MNLPPLPDCFRKGGHPVALTAYSYPFARLLDEAGVDMVLVGDSLGMVEQGRPDTVDVTLEEMAYHVRIARAGVSRALLVGDLPANTYTSPECSLRSARTLLAAGADAVKLEGGIEVTPQVRALCAEGVRVVGHIGMLPQRIRKEGRYRIKGKSPEEREALLADASALADAGAFCIILELVEPSVAAEITAALPIPTIGIGSGLETDGQILVTYDLIGLSPWFRPSFVRPKLEIGAQILTAVREWASEVRRNKTKQSQAN